MELEMVGAVGFLAGRCCVSVGTVVCWEGGGMWGNVRPCNGECIF